MTIIATAPVPDRVNLALEDTQRLHMAVFPPCPSFCTDDHSKDPQIDDEIGLRLHERVVLEVASTDATIINETATARVMVERCDIANEPAAPAKIVLSIDHPDAPTVDDVDVAEATRSLSDATCRAIAAMCLAGAEKTGMAMTLAPAAALQLAEALRQAADWSGGPR